MASAGLHGVRSQDSLARVARWRRRRSGAWQWPVFGACAVGEIVLVRELPPVGDGTSLAQAFVWAGALNLIVVAVLAPLAALLLRHVRPDLPRVIARDYAGTVLLLGLAAVLLAVGLLHRPQVARAERDLRVEAGAVERYVARQAGPVYRANVARADTWELEPHLFRTCVPSDDPRRALCMFVNTAHGAPQLRLDPSTLPNSRLAGPPDFGG